MRNAQPNDLTTVDSYTGQLCVWCPSCATPCVTPDDRDKSGALTTEQHAAASPACAEVIAAWGWETAP